MEVNDQLHSLATWPPGKGGPTSHSECSGKEKNLSSILNQTLAIYFISSHFNG